MGGLGMQELLIIAVIVAILFGFKKLPSIGKDLGSGIREFKKAMKELAHDDDKD
jgi:sec-independent protein translocase protein TatA